MRSYLIALTIVFVLLFKLPGYAQDTVVYTNAETNIQIGNKIGIFEDKDNTLSVEQAIHSDKFTTSKLKVPNLEVTASSIWIKIFVRNATASKLALELAYATIDSVTLVSLQPDGSYSVAYTGEFVPYYRRPFKHQNYIFDLNIPTNETRTYFIKVNSSEQYQLPLVLGTPKSIDESIFNKDLIFGLYAGIILVMFLYNIFVFFTVRDRTYLYYVLYILMVGLTQACLQGYAPRFLYPDSPYFANFMMVLVPALVGITAIVFLKNFLQVRKFTPKLYHLLTISIIVYSACIVLGLFKYYRLSAQILQANVGILAAIVITIGIKIMRKGYRPAYFFMLAWSIFIASVVVFVLRNFNVLPYNNFTYYAMQIGSALEVVLLSFALADKINIFRKEKEESQAQAMVALQENERIVREQNVILENKVNERTFELKVSNDGLNKAMTELKDAQSQLVDAEKMASLGQLTAGIAHEINNPINFVTSNVKPLNRDVKILIDTVTILEKVALGEADFAQKKKMIEEYKTDIDYDYLKLEIDQLLNGIGEGASRTAEIVKGLRIFSRLDEDDLKKADINEGLDSTLIITNNMMNNIIKVQRNFGNLPVVECYPGKLNQVFLNIISNAVYAIRKKFGEAEGGVITITTNYDNDGVVISITDNGTGMDEHTRKRLFEPFFTTKDVGEGTGLGLSIAYNTINKHNGQIIVNSEIGKGTEFILKLPLIQKH